MTYSNLSVGKFYWAQPTFCVDDGAEIGEWPFVQQPARFVGYDSRGEAKWEWIGHEDDDWPSCWVGGECI